MQVTQTTADGLKREFAVVVAAAEIETKIAARLEQLATTTQLPGFRPGKVPVGLMRQKYGDAVTGEVLEDSVNLGTQQALAENELKPALQPQIEITKFEPGSDLEYTIAVEVLPTIVATDFSQLKLERLKAEPSETEVELAIDRLAQAQRVYTEEEGRPAADGDAAVIDFAGSIDGELFDGGSGQDHELVLGSQSFIPGFEDQLLGAKAGDEISVKVDFPDDYPAPHLQGKAALFETTVKAVKVCEELALDDAFAQRLGLESMEALQKAVREQIGHDYDGASRERLKRSLLDALAGSHDFEVPPGMVAAELDAIWQTFGEQATEAAQQGQSPDQAELPDEAETKERYAPVAERRVRLGLLLSEVGQQNNIEVHPEEVNQAISAQARRFPGQERQVIEYFQKDPQAQAQLRAPIFEDKVIDFILELAGVEDRLVAIEELMREPEDEMTALLEGDGEKKPAKKPAKKSAKAKGEADGEEAAKPKAKAKAKAKPKAKPKAKAKTAAQE